MINQNQVDVYADADWRYKADPSEVMVLHTLVIDPGKKGKGDMKFYEDYALKNNCKYLRIDTNEKKWPEGSINPWAMKKSTSFPAP